MKHTAKAKKLFLLFAAVFISSHGYAQTDKNNPKTITSFRVVERAGVARHREPVTVGIPLPRSLLGEKDMNRLVLLSKGEVVPSSFRPAGWWWESAKGPNGPYSVKWVLVDFQADVPPSGSVTYTLAVGGKASAQGKNVAKGTPNRVVYTKNEDGSIILSTGKIKVRMSPNRFTVIDKVWSMPAGTLLVDASKGRGIVLLTAWKGLPRNAVYSSAASNASLEVEQANAMRVTVKASGKLTLLNGPSSLPPHTLDYECRITAYAGKPYIQVELVYYNRHIEEGEGLWSCIPVDGLMVEIPLEGRPRKIETMLGGKGLSAAPEREGKTYIYAKGSDTITCGGAFSGTSKGKSIWPKDTGWMSVTTDRCVVGCGIRWFWQLWPKAIETDGRKMVIHLWPNLQRRTLSVPKSWRHERALRSREVPGRANVYLGMSHTYRFFLSFGDASDVEEAWWALSSPLRGMCSPEWYCEKTMAFGPLGSSTKRFYTPERWNMVENYDKRVREWLDFIAYQRPKKYYGSEDGFGEFNFGDHVNYDYDKKTDVPRDLLWDNNYYGFPHACILQFVRTGDLTYLDVAERFGTHLHDIDMVCWHPRKDMIGANRYSPSAMHIFTDRNLSKKQPVYASNTYNHFKNQSHFERWYLLGDTHARDMGILSAMFVVHRKTKSLSQGRSVGHGIVGSLSGWYATGDRRFLEAARSIVRAKRNFKKANGAWQDGIAVEGFVEYYYLTGSRTAYQAAVRSAKYYADKKRTSGSMLQGFGFLSANEGHPTAMQTAIEYFNKKCGYPKRSWGSVMDFGNTLRNMGYFIWYLQKGDRRVKPHPLRDWQD